jgi:hypothetical protein
VGAVPESQRWITEKTELLTAANRSRNSNPPRGRLTRDEHRRLSEIRTRLLTFTGSLQNSYESERKAILSRLAANALLRNREFSFVLFPEEQVRQFLMSLSENLSTPAFQSTAST